MGRTLVLSSTYPQFEGDPRGAFLRRYWEARVQGGESVRVLAPVTAWTKGELSGGVELSRFSYAPRRFATLTGRFGIRENLRERPWRALLLPNYLVAQRRALGVHLREFKPDRVCAHMFLPGGWEVAKRCRARGIPYELFGHGSDVDLVMTLPSALTRSFQRGLKGAQRVHFPSHAKLVSLARYVGFRDRPPAHWVVSTMVETIRGRLCPTAERERPREGVLFVGRLIRQKGLDVLLDALARLPDAPSLTVAGDGPERSRLQLRARSLGLAVEFCGYVDEARRDALYRRAAVVVVPSCADGGWSEGAPLVIPEALACGAPVVASALGGIPELCRGVSTATLVPPGDALALSQVLRDLPRAKAKCQVSPDGRSAA